SPFRRCAIHRSSTWQRAPTSAERAMFQKQSLTMAVAAWWCSLSSPSLAFPPGAALSAASASGTTVPFSGMMIRKGCFRRRLPQQQQQQQQQHGRSGYS
ncbi:unnamed protein product, partial [Ectocarpus sp. 12 AP-2014]